MSFKGNYFSAPWNSNNPTLAVSNTFCCNFHWSQRRSCVLSSKLRVMYAAKQPPKLFPSLVESLATHCLISGTMDEQSLVSYRVSRLVLFFLFTLLLLLQSVGENVLSAQRSCCRLFMSHLFCFLLLPPTLHSLALSLANHSVLHKR